MFPTLIASVLLAAQARDSCDWRFEYVSEATSRSVDAKVAEALENDLSIAEIVRVIGPAKRDRGSGLHVLEWELSDGRRLWVSAADACSRPVGRSLKPKGGT
jgi:hypothetical protein